MKYKKINNIPLLSFESFPEERLLNCSTTIEGGISEGAYNSLNLGFTSGDNHDSVLENRTRLGQAIGVLPENIITAHQTHEDKIKIIDQEFLNLPFETKLSLLDGIDALITQQKNIFIAVGTADCVPILLYEKNKHVLAAIHAGWKGTVLRLADKTIKKMKDVFHSQPEDILAGIGPCISQPHFEVGNEVVEQFSKSEFDIHTIGKLNQSTNKMHIDLVAANKQVLLRAGITDKNIEQANLCTYANPDRFFSARRQTFHSGRMLTGGVLR